MKKRKTRKEITAITTLLIDFNNYNGHQMVLAGKEPFQKSSLHELELNMLRENTINSLLPLNWMEMDGEISFYYAIEGYRLLAHYLRTQQFTMRSYYSLLLSIADGLATCYEYMLRPECCLIDEHLLYFNEQTERIMLAYVPLQKPLHEEQSQQLLLLAVRWSALVNDLDTIGYHRILQLLSAEKLPIIPFRQLLLDLIHEQTKGLAGRASDEHENVLQDGMRQQIGSNLQTEAAIATMNGLQDQRNVTTKAERLVQAAEENHSALQQNTPEFDHWQELEGDDLYEEEDSEHARLTWKHYTIVVIILTAIAMTWIKLYRAEQAMDNLMLCSGITAGLLALLGYVILKPVQSFYATRNKEDQVVFEPLPVTQYAANASARLAEMLQGGNASASTAMNNEVANEQQQTTFEEVQPSNSSRQQMEEPAEIKSRSSQKLVQLATVKLDEDQATSMLQSAELMLLRSMNGTEERISINEASFLIGRAEEGVHFRETAKGVSRIHVEFERSNGKLQVKDAGSRNGTFLNDQLMIAYKTYPLRRGDKLQLASREGPIYELVNGVN